ncbi:MAG: ATP-binding cassette domain-containing protein [Chloroflexota bacterium]|nr:ATP-binding cassette domain-containing protein [Chloroflexota bacterium]MDE2908700.1 ATP-binding cassette domain-containing protein [Chloroflexota bacterium]
MEARPALETKDLSRYFKGVVALNDVSVAISPGEVVGLVGDNGAGKSTLVKILSGDLEPSSGQVLIEGEEVHFRHPRDAKKRQIETIYQDLALCENLDIMENVFLGHESYRNPLLRLLDRRRMYRETSQLLEELAIRVPSTRELVMNLSGGQRQATALARVAKAGARLIILDEPTAALGVNETRNLLDLVLRFKAQGKTIIIISHEMRDVFEVTDRIIVLKRGELIADKLTAATDPDEIVRYIIRGRD